MPQEILLLEDDDSLNHTVSLKLKREGYTVRSAFTVKEAFILFRQFSPSLIICDITLPDGNGLDFCSRIRQESDVLFLFLTALDREEDMMAGYRQGADDYITKPFSVRELMARVKSNIRRGDMVPRANPDDRQGLRLGRIRLDGENAACYKDGVLVDLSQREFELISFLCANPDKVFSREALMEHVWNYEGYVGDVRGVDVAVRRLREKLEDDPGEPRFVMTRRGVGYYFNSQHTD